MTTRTARILRIVFATVGSLALLLGIASIVLVIMLNPPEYERGLWGSLLYLAIGGACAYAFVRLKRSSNSSGA